MADNRVVMGNHRFTCLAPGLVRMEFAPDGKFEERRSIVAYAQQKPLAFKSAGKAFDKEGDWDMLDTGAVQIIACGHSRAFNRISLEVRWSDGKACQLWRPDDRDYQNLGGTLRSLDRYGNEWARLDGVQIAGMEPPDAASTNWPAWLQCEVDPLFDKLHPNPPEHFGQGDWLAIGSGESNNSQVLERTFNWYKEARRFCPGVLSKSGYYFLNDSYGAVMDGDDFPIERDRPGYQDWYFFAYGKDFKQALRDFRLLCGPAPLPTHRSFGIIFSRWPAFTEDEIEGMSQDFAANGYPLSTIVMDMEWHKEGWGHWEFNPELIPDPKRFFALCRKHGLEVTFNDHPLDVREDDCHFDGYLKQAGPGVTVREREYNGKHLRMAKVDICDKKQNQAFREVCHAEIMKLGLDYWWNDGSRGQMSATCGQLVTNKTFFEESEREGRRGMMLARYGGLGSHRYGGFFTGDANSDYHVLKLQCEFNIRAGAVGISNVSHDIGGFVCPSSQVKKNKAGEAIIDAERYLRWLQFAVFGPILRFHSAPGCGSRKPSDYESEVNGACRKWLRLRHGLLPYIYTAAYQHFETGIPLVRGLYLEEPENPESYRFDQYYFGPAMLVAPMLADERKRTLYLPQGEWWEFETAKRIEGGIEISRPVALDEVPVYVKAGSIIPRQSPDAPLHQPHIGELLLDVYAGANGEAGLYEDDGVSPGYKQGKFSRTSFALAETETRIAISGRLAEGQPFGKARSITIMLSSAAKVVSATLMGQGAVQLKVGGNGRLEIALPEMPADKPWTLEIKKA